MYLRKNKSDPRRKVWDPESNDEQQQKNSTQEGRFKRMLTT